MPAEAFFALSASLLLASRRVLGGSHAVQLLERLGAQPRVGLAAERNVRIAVS